MYCLVKDILSFSVLQNLKNKQNISVIIEQKSRCQFADSEPIPRKIRNFSRTQLSLKNSKLEVETFSSLLAVSYLDSLKSALSFVELKETDSQVVHAKEVL